MNGRRKENAGTRSVLEREPAQSREYQAPAPARRRGRKTTFGKVIPFLFMVGIGLLIAHEEIPAFADWWEKSFSPQNWSAKKACQEAAVGNATNPAYVRVLDSGQAHKTEQGLYIDGMRLGEMAADGTEQEVGYSCYVDSAGVVVRLNRLQEGHSIQAR